MWNVMVKANWNRDSRSAVISIAILLTLSPQVRSGEIDEIVAAAVEHGFDHVEREAFGHFDSNGGRGGGHCSAHPPTDDPRSPLGNAGRHPRVALRGSPPPH